MFRRCLRMAAEGAEPADHGLQPRMLVGVLVGLAVIPFSIVYRARVFALRHDINTEMAPVLYERFLWVKAGLDFALNVILLAGCLVRGTALQTPAAAAALGALFQLEEVANLWLMFRMGQLPFQFLVLKDDASEVDVFYMKTLRGGLALGLLFTVPVLAAGLCGDNGLFFWFRDYKAEFYAFYWFALCISLLCAATFVRVSRVAEHRRRKALRHVRYGDYYTRMTVEIAVALFFDTAIWLLPYFLRVASWASAADGRRPGWRARWARLLDVYAIGYRGAVDAAVYLPKDGLVAVYRVLRRLWVRMWGRPKRSFMKEGADLEAGTGGTARADPPRVHNDGNDNGNDQVHLMLLGPTRPLPFFTDRPRPRLEERNMFVSTFNCGECSLESLAGRLGEWIPREGVAVYVIGVQECMCMEGLKEAILDHVGRDAFMCWDDAIGSTVTALGFHGFIGLLVLARIEDVKAGTFMIYESQRQRVARGKNLGLARAQNKGGVGLAFRYYDTAFGCCVVHLASDSKGRCKLKQRLQDAHDLLSMTSLWGEAYKDVDLQHQHHVTLFLGDVNFRVKRSCPRRVLDDLAHICRREKEGRHAGAGDWRRRAYAAVLRPGGEGAAAAGAPRGGARGAVGGGDVGDGPDPRLLEDPRTVSWVGEQEEGEEECSSHGGDEVVEEEDGDDDEEEEEEEVEEVEEMEGRRRNGHALNGNGKGEEEQGEGYGDEEAAVRLEGRQSQGQRQSRVAFLRPARPPSIHARLSRRESAVRETWEDFLRADELTQSMAAGAILHGFVEGEIRFPPSYRRRRGAEGECGDYTDPSALKEAYSIYVKDKGGLKRIITSSISAISTMATPASLPPPAAASLNETPRQSSGSSSINSASTGGTTTTTTAAPDARAASGPSDVVGPSPAAERGRQRQHQSIRIPSYTDRILLHVQPERRGRVTLTHYESCDAITSSDHKPVSAILALHADTGLRGLGSFLPMIRHHPTNSSSGSGSDSGSATPLSLAAEAPAVAVPRPLPLTVCSVQDAAFYHLQVRNVRVDFAIGAARGLFPPAAAARPDHSLLQCPLAFEDCFRDLRRPAYVAQICRHMAFLTREARMNPFGYVNLKTWADVERGGYALVTCLRPEFGMRAAIWVRSGRVVLGSAVLPLLDEEGRPLAEQKGLRVPTTRGGVHTGFFTCDVNLMQLAISPREQRLFA